MNRKTAREIAVELCFAAAANGVDTDELVDSFFSEEHYTTLGTEDELFSAKPDETQLAYIRTLTRLSREKAEELDDMIERYARGALYCVSLCAKSCIWTTSPPRLPSTKRLSLIKVMTTRRPSRSSTAFSAASCAEKWPQKNRKRNNCG